MKKHQLLLVFIVFFGLAALAQTSKNTGTKDFSVSTGESGGNLKITVKPVERELSAKEKAAVEMFALLLSGSEKAGSPVNEILIENVLNGLAKIAEKNISTIQRFSGHSDKQRRPLKPQLPIPDSKAKAKTI